MSEFIIGQSVKVAASHNQFEPCTNTKYEVAAIDKVGGEYATTLRLNGQIMGVIPERKLSAK